MPPKKKIKTEDGAGAGTRAGTTRSRRRNKKEVEHDDDDDAIPDGAASLSSAQPDNAPSSSNSLADAKLFEFKFTSIESSTFQDYEVNGFFHIPLMIENGILSIPTNAGVWDVTGRFTWRLRRAIGSSTGVSINLPIHGKVASKVEGSTDQHVLRFGYSCKTEPPAGIEFKAIDWGQVQDVNDFGDDEFISSTTIEEFAAKAGGEMKFENESGKVLTLYTVVSELRPGQSKEELKLARSTKKPDWDRLGEMAETHPSMADLDVESAITEYKRYLALKLLEKDSTSEEFAPSPDVDKVWHLHLSYPEQYQQDVFAFAKQLKVKGKVSVIPHCPFLMKESKERYTATYNSITMKKLEKAVGKKVDMKFWPAIDELYSESENEGGGCGGCAGCC